MIEVRQFDGYDDDESILFTGQVTLPTDEGEPDRPAVEGEYPLRVYQNGDGGTYQNPDPFDHEPIPGWVTAIVIVGTLAAMFAIGAAVSR